MPENHSDEDKVLQRIRDARLSLKSLAKKNPIDTRVLVSLLESEIVPCLLTVMQFSVAREAYFEEELEALSERVDSLEEPESQIHPDDAQKLIAHLMAIGELLGHLVQQTPAPNNEALIALKNNNDAAIKAIRDATITVDEDDDDEDDDEDDEEDEDEDGDDSDDDDTDE